jgi:hypothetical protein
MPEVPPMPPPRRPLTKPAEFKPYRLQRETSEPGVETYSINPSSMARWRVWFTEAPDSYVTVTAGGYMDAMRLAAREFRGSHDGEVREMIAKIDGGRAIESLVTIGHGGRLTFHPSPSRGNPPPGEHHRRAAARKGWSPHDEAFYVMDEDENGAVKFNNLNDALTALAQLNSNGRISLGTADGKSGDIIAWSGPPYADSTDGELTIVDVRGIRRMFSLAMIRRFNELRDKAQPGLAMLNPSPRENPPKKWPGEHISFKEWIESVADQLVSAGIPRWKQPEYFQHDPRESVDRDTLHKAWLARIPPHVFIEQWKEKLDPKENPAWVTKILSKHLVKLEEEVPPRFLPKITKAAFSRGGRISATMKEYGCGAYGCVLPTLDPSVVLKLTTDDTEAEFANDLAGKLTKPVVVKYHMTRELPDKYKGRPSFLLWRDAADHVGQVEQTIAEESGVDPTVVEEAIGNQHVAAQAAYEALDEGEPAVELLQKWEDAAREMGLMVPELRELAEGMITNLQKDKVFMGDVHSGNIGRVNGHWVVVDPGHIAVLTATAEDPRR